MSTINYGIIKTLLDYVSVEDQSHVLAEIFDYASQGASLEYAASLVLQENTSAQIISFNKEANGLWYFDSPEYLEVNGINSKGNLLMVGGADTLLDILNPGTDRVTMILSRQPLELDEEVHCKQINRTGFEDEQTGATYLANGNGLTDYRFWLCPVLFWLFDEYPQNLHFKQIL